ncbi:ATP-binding cassette domain-containing protein [Granulosicoccus sp.]|nr:ATP-binding cassette domain-containing protein [Granulosicoccus sp.]
MILELNQVVVNIQKTPILRCLSLAINDGEFIGLVGRNGAGKTTTLRTVMGLITPVSGSVKLFGRDVSGVQAHLRPALGIGYMPEDRRLVPQLTVEENILLPSWVIAGLDHQASLKFIYDLMPELYAMKDRKALLLSGGQQKMVALGRALMAGIKLLVFDEPFEGVAPALAGRLVEVISALRQEGRSILVAQSELSHAGELMDREYIIERGEILSDDEKPKTVTTD